MSLQVWLGDFAFKVGGLGFGNHGVLEALGYDVGHFYVQIGSALEVSGREHVLALIFGFDIFDDELLNALCRYELENSR